MASLVFSYSHADETLRNELEKHLAPLKRMGKISTWHDRRIVPGQVFADQIDKHFSEADIILLLVSSDFIASDYCYQIEMSNALQRHERGEAVVIPVILRSCAWHQLPFGKLLAATSDGKPITQFASYDDGFVEVVGAVSRALDERNGRHSAQVPANIGGPQGNRSQGASISTGHDSSPRSSNLAIPRRITDLDRDRACREGFDYLARFFENSLRELKERNPDLDVDFHRRDADAFACSVYLNGNKACHCGIWKAARGTGLGDICYSQSGISHNSCNESMSVADNGQLIGFRALMGGLHGGRQRDPLLTNEGMAEHLWDMFILPLKHQAR
ncbi:MAG: toll/interleukin-1 receptor domain-containing protein [Pseudomonas profundi]|uniref:toll/interleukin-1 receptor domain-containing protein n=1 Tax=Pseudomonas profundi TaxID=1981513 RepID=UPI0030031788